MTQVPISTTGIVVKQTTKPIDLPQKPDKVVTFSCREGVWSVDVEINSTSGYFTNRDFNQMSVLLNVRRSRIRQQAALKYAANQRKMNQVKPLVGDTTPKIEVLNPLSESKGILK